MNIKDVNNSSIEDAYKDYSANEDYIKFVEKIYMALKEYYKELADVQMTETKKNNGIILKGVSVKWKNSNIAPNIYLENLFDEYNKGKTLGDIVNMILKVCNDNRGLCRLDMDFFSDYDKVKHMIVYRLVNTKKNQELLKEIPHIEYLDMSIIFYCYMEKEMFEQAIDQMESGCIVIYNSHLELWGKTAEDIYEQAKINTPLIMEHEWIRMDDLLLCAIANRIREENRIKKVEMSESEVATGARALLSVYLEGKNMHMHVLSNKQQRYGATALLYDDILKSFSIKSQHNLIIIPSSIHEVIIVPDEGLYDIGELKALVNEVNSTEVPLEDVLSDSVYRYDFELDKVSIV